MTGGETCVRGADMSEASSDKKGVVVGSCAADPDRLVGKFECTVGLEYEALV